MTATSGHQHPSFDRDAEVLDRIRGGLIVSCQSDLGPSLGVAGSAALMAANAARGGAVGIRTNGPSSVRAVRELVPLPIIGLQKVPGARRNIITESLEDARELAASGADIIAIEYVAETATDHPARIAALRDDGLCVMADVSTLDEGIAAWQAGAQLVSTTLSGYTPYTTSQATDPDIALVGLLHAAGVRVVAEGRLWTPAHVRAALDAGAFAVVVGSAITDPTRITAQLVGAIPHPTADETAQAMNGDER